MITGTKPDTQINDTEQRLRYKDTEIKSSDF